RHTHTVHLGMPLQVLLGEQPHEAAADPVALLGRKARPVHAAHALHLVALHRHDDLAAAGIAADDAQLHAQNIDQHDRHLAQRRAFAAGADDHLLVEGLLERLHRRVGAHYAEIDAAVGAPEHDEL